jgi:ubiquinone/menaquinone biosynthesis C-methylase UbiE
MTAAGYIFDPAWEHELDRLRAVERLWDPSTQRRLEALGVGPGWRCLEVGGGGGSIARWLAERVGAAGSVLATDRDPRFLERVRAPSLEVVQHDVTTDPLPRSEFQLVHARLLVENVSDPVLVLGKLVDALAPGGALLVEDYDFGTRLMSPPLAAFDAVNAAHRRHLESLGCDPEMARKLYGWLRALPLRDLALEGSSLIYGGGSPDAVARRMSLEQRRALFVARGWASEAELDEAIAALGDPANVFFSPIMVAASARRA